MTGPQKTSMIGLGALALAVALTDVWYLVDGEEGNTFSSVIQGQSWLSGVIGYIAIHASRKPSERGLTSSWWWVAGGAILAGVGSEALGGGVAGLVIGGALGWAFWSNSGRT